MVICTEISVFVVEMWMTLQALLCFLQRRDAAAVSADSDNTAVYETRCMNEELESFHKFKSVKVSQPSDRGHREVEEFHE